MAPEPTRHPANATASSLAGQPLARWGKPLSKAAAIVFVVSTAFPVGAAFVTDRESWPKWWGVLDVSIAFVLVILAFAIMTLAYGKVDKPAEAASYHAYRVLIHGILAMLVVFFLFGDRIVWSNCLTGFAWRFWLLLYGLPAWFTVFWTTPGFSGVSESSRAS